MKKAGLVANLKQNTVIQVYKFVLYIYSYFRSTFKKIDQQNIMQYICSVLTDICLKSFYFAIRINVVKNIFFK